MENMAVAVCIFPVDLTICAMEIISDRAQIGFNLVPRSKMSWKGNFS